MGLFNQFPYTNFHELNLNWILNALMEIQKTMEQFVAINSLKYADPILWDITSQYEKNTIVIDPQSGTAYISVQAVPSGVALTNTDYWTVVFNLEQFVTRANNNLTVRVEETTTLNATFATPINHWLIWNNVLYRATTNIIPGDQYVENSNIVSFTIEDIVGYIQDLQTTNKDNIIAAINELVTNIGDMTTLNTTDKSTIVAAINEVLTTLTTVAGDLTNLTTTDKSNLVAAINEVLTTLTTVTGDLTNLTTTDKSNLVAAINEVLTTLTTVTGDLTDLTTTDKSNLVAAINEIHKAITENDNKFTILIGDSYGRPFTDHRERPWTYRVRDYLGANNCYIVARNGVGFCTAASVAEWEDNPEACAILESNNYLACLIDAYNNISDKSKVKRIVVCGGGNDGPYILDYIYPAMEHFGTRAKELFPDAEVYIGYIFWNVNIDQSNVWSTLRKTFTAYIRCQDYGMLYLSGVENILRDYGLMDTEAVEGAMGTHPNELGCTALARGIINALESGYSPVYRIHTQVSLTNLNAELSESAISIYAFETQKDNYMYLRTNSHTFTLSTPKDITTNFAIGDLEKRYWLGNYDTSCGVEIPVLVVHSDDSNDIEMGYLYLNRYGKLNVTPRGGWTDVKSFMIGNIIMTADTFTAA